jgi:hypothetical protein
MTQPHPSRALRLVPLVTGLLFGGAAQAIDFGPFSLNGFAKTEVTRVSSYCPDCQLLKDENRQRYWADEIVQGKPYGPGTTDVTLVQPYLGVKFDLPKGLKIAGLLSQRWRDGKEDFKGFWYDKNVALSHDDYGSLRIGAMTTRAWSMADYPYGSNIGVSDAWASSGAGYGLLTRAARLSTRPLDVYDGNLVLELTYDAGKSGWKKNKPEFYELYLQFAREGLVVDAMLQSARNGTPSAFGHGPFTGLTPFPRDDEKLGSSSQSIAMIMARYQVDPNLEISGGLRANRWSGAWAVFTDPSFGGQWNSMFNVDWGPNNNACPCKGYPATSTDLMLGARYRVQQWTVSTGLVHFSAAATANPTERGQSNSATINTLGLNYDFRNGAQVYLMGGMVRYARKGLAPLTMPSHSAFTNIDPRIETKGTWYGAGAVYTF